MDGARDVHPEASAEVLPGEVYELHLALEKGMLFKTQPGLSAVTPV